MALLDLLGRRWVLRILWELREESLGFRTLQVRCDGLSPTILSRRLRELRSLAMVHQDDSGKYQLTKIGGDLVKALLPVRSWAEGWAALLKG